MPIFDEPLRFTSDEVTLPGFHTPEDLDWVAFSWDLHRVRPTRVESNLVLQFVLAPGTLLLRKADPSDNPLNPGVKIRVREVERKIAPHRGMSAMEYATAKTSVQLSHGFTYGQTPYVCDFRSVADEFKNLVSSNYPERAGSVHTLGDALAYPGVVNQFFFDLIAAIRPQDPEVGDR